MLSSLKPAQTKHLKEKVGETQVLHLFWTNMQVGVANTVDVTVDVELPDGNRSFIMILESELAYFYISVVNHANPNEDDYACIWEVNFLILNSLGSPERLEEALFIPDGNPNYRFHLT